MCVLVAIAILLIVFVIVKMQSKPALIPAVTAADRIFFSDGNPWAEGHAVKRCYLDAQIYEGDLLQVIIHFESNEYCDNDGGQFLDNGKEGDWESKTVWNNYHSCNIDGVILRATPGNPISLESLESSVHHIDPLPEALERFVEDELEFSIYLLGHDSVADHRIELGELSEAGYPMKWTGRIALSYSGEYDFDYAFALESTLKPLSRVWYPQEWDDAKAEEVLSDLMREAEKFRLGTVDGRKAFVLRKSDKERTEQGGAR